MKALLIFLCALAIMLALPACDSKSKDGPGPKDGHTDHTH